MATFDIGNLNTTPLSRKDIITASLDSPDATCLNIGKINATAINIGHPSLSIHVNSESLFVNGTVVPKINMNVDIGQSSLRFNNIFCGAINLPSLIIETKTIQTNASAAAMIKNITLDKNAICSVKITAIVKEINNNQYAMLNRVGCFYREDGTVKQLGNIQKSFDDISTNEGIDILLQSFENNITIQAIGLDLVMNWAITIEHQYVTGTL